MRTRLQQVNPLTFRKKGTHAKALLALALVSFLWGTTWVASKAGVKYMPALQLAGIRQLVGGTGGRFTVGTFMLVFWIGYLFVWRRDRLPEERS